MRLLGEKGLDGLSLSKIGLAAGQGNNTIAHYYFESRDKLISAIGDYMYRLHPDLHDTIDGFDDSVVDWRGIATRLVDRMFQLLHRNPAYIPFLARILGDPARRRLYSEHPAPGWYFEVAGRRRGVHRARQGQ